LTKGLAFLLVDSKKAFESLRKRLKWYTQRDFVKYDEINLEKLFEEIENSRKIEKKQNFKTTLIIVESPTKAKTIASFYGRPSRRIVNGMIFYEILLPQGLLTLGASTGHDFDLCYDYGKWGVIDKYIPVFELIEGKRNIIEGIKYSAFETDEVFVATDPDREGEKIAFDVSLNIKPYNLNVRRIEFHEITKKAFENAVSTPHEVKEKTVSSQFVRRIADRWIGFGISEYLRKKLNNPYLSTGRVQTPVLKWICDNTESLKEKVYVLEITLNGVKIDYEFNTLKEAKNFYSSLPETLKPKLLEKKQESIFMTPFNTSSLLKEASLKLKFSPQYTMKLAQELFENGFITYHRTDSIRVSSLGIQIAKEYIFENFSKDLFVARSFESSEGAHECIRPTSNMDVEDLKIFLMSKNRYLSKKHIKLYDLIFRRFIASQMKEAIVNKCIYSVLDKKIEILCSIVSQGFGIIYPIKVYSLEEKDYEYDKFIKKVSKNKPYSYADIIEMMKEKGIGRPSTYAVTIEKLLDKKYIKEKNGYLFATRLGFVVLEESLKSEFKEFVSEEFTAKLEEIMDEVEEGKKDYKEIVIWLFSLLF
jgi:reverse gyrase